MSKPTFALIINTYNHTECINDLLESIQKCCEGIDLDIVIFDDCSTDDTYTKLLAFKATSNINIRVVQPEVNQYSNGRIVLLLAFQYTKADYIFLCEGDDYILSLDKFHLQSKYMIDNVNCALSLHSALRNGLTYIGLNEGAIRAISQAELSKRYYSIGKTCTFCVRRDVLEAYERNFVNVQAGDNVITAIAGMLGEVVYLPDIKSFYRYDVSAGSNSHSSRMTLTKSIDFLRLQRAMSLNQIDKITELAQNEVGESLNLDHWKGKVRYEFDKRIVRNLTCIDILDWDQKLNSHFGIRGFLLSALIIIVQLCTKLFKFK